MIMVLVYGSILITLNVIIQAYSNVYWFKKIKPYFRKNAITVKKTLLLLIFSFLFFTLLHTLHTFIWALGFYLNPETANDFTDFPETLYFSIVTFTTLGYGDITLNSHWRLLSGLEAINGIMLIGWSTAMMYSLIQSIHKKLKD
ncbi:MAG: potassium channel family protein [Flavobacteriaceae bacterium]